MTFHAPTVLFFTWCMKYLNADIRHRSRGLKYHRNTSISPLTTLLGRYFVQPSVSLNLNNPIFEIPSAKFTHK